MNTMVTDRRQSDAVRNWSAWDMARLLFHWVAAGAAVAVIGSLFLLTQILPGETVPILISAFAMLGIGLAGFYLWALAVGLPEIRRTFYGPMPLWSRGRRQKVQTPWFDHNGTMLWQHDGRGGWMRKVDVASAVPEAAEQMTDHAYH